VSIRRRCRFCSAPCAACAAPGADPVENYANYNFTLLQLGSCTDARTSLDQARRPNPDRHESSARSPLPAPARPAKNHGKGKGRGKHQDEHD
jgi:hypothetical protein